VSLRWTDGDKLPDAARAALLGPGAPFELSVEDVMGSSMEVFAQRAPTLPALLATAASRMPDRPYVTFPERAWTFASILGPVASVAAALRDQFGVGPGDRVAIVAANTSEWVLTFWAATCLGAVTVALNGWWTGAEIEYGLELTRPSVLLGDRRRLERLVGPAGVPTVVFEDGFAALEDHPPIDGLLEAPIGEDDPYLVLFTSGTTGRPKGALLSHRSTIHFIQSSFLNAAVHGALHGRTASELPPCVINASPLFHVSGLNCQLVMSVASGSHIVYPVPGKWHHRTHLELTERHQATSWSLVPTQLWRILEDPDLDRYDLSSLSSVGGGGSVWAPELLRTLTQCLPSVRPIVGTGFGSTETNGLGTTLRPPHSYEHPDSIGSACPAAEIEIMDGDTPVPPGAVGEICIRSASVFLGYWDNPDATAASIGPDRWYHTGDIGRIDDGFVYLAGRRRDLIIRGGENIYPVEIENRILEHPEVAEVAVIGVPHDTLGHEVKAVVVCRGDATLDAEDVRSWCGVTLAAFKVPAIVEFVATLPHNASGKVLKHLLEQPEAAAAFIEE
jgi:acyl-CoA synthetase (AMP-forming)/AMP-acid ligase II